jgi:hypothetical protein
MTDDYKTALTRRVKATSILKTRSRGSWLQGLRGAVTRGVARRPWPRKK